MAKSGTSGGGSKNGMKETALAGVGSLIKLLPTGTVFLFQFLNPVVSNNGNCHPLNKYLTGILIGLCGFSCCFASFTDSYTDEDGNTHYGVATGKGLWPAPAGNSVDLSAYRLRLGDFVHAFFSLIVFAAVALLDPNTVDCFYPSLESTQKSLLVALPAVIGAISSSVFVIFPNNRHGIGYPPPPQSLNNSQKKNTNSEASMNSCTCKR